MGGQQSIPRFLHAFGGLGGASFFFLFGFFSGLGFVFGPSLGFGFGQSLGVGGVVAVLLRCRIGLGGKGGEAADVCRRKGEKNQQKK